MMSEDKEKTTTDSSETSGESINNDNNETGILEDEWLIRDCDVYDDEYDECTSIKGRFHQYFIFGETLDCNQWKKDYDNCCKWQKKSDVKAAEALIMSEKARRMARLKAHYKNDVWKKRDSPPLDWDKPLPEWMAKRDENTYLAHKAKELKEGKDIEEKSSCVIM